MIMILDGVTIPSPDSVAFEKYDISNANRLANGKMQLSLIAKKIKLNLSYDYLEGEDLETIASLIVGNNAMFMQLVYSHSATLENNTIECYSGAIKYTSFLSDDGMWVWKDVKFSLIER